MIDSKEKNFISIVIYIYNNESIITKFLSEMNEIIQDKFQKYEIICVNDCSTDSSVQKIKEFAETLPNTVVSVLNMSFFQGLEVCMNAGVDLSIGDFVYEFDSINDNYDLHLMIQIYDKALEGYDIVNVSPSQNLRVSSKLFYKLYNKYAQNSYLIETEVFRILSRRAINRIHAMNLTIPYRKAVYNNCGLKICNVKYKVFHGDKIKRQKKSESMRKETAIDSLILFTDVAYKFSLYMTFIMMFITVAVGIYAVAIFAGNSPIAGWTTIMLFLSLAFFGIFSVSAVIIKYLSTIVNLIFKKQKYIIESIEKITK